MLKCTDKLERTASWDAEREAAATDRDEVSAAPREASDALREASRDEKDASIEEKEAEKEEITGPENWPLMQQMLLKQSRLSWARETAGRRARRMVVGFIVDVIGNREVFAGSGEGLMN